MTKEITNRIDLMFPMVNNRIEDISNENSLATTELWSKLSDKFVNRVQKILAPLGSVILDVQTDLQVTNPDAMPTVQVEVVSSVGNALVDTTDWNQSAINSRYEDVKLHRISRPFALTSYDLMHGERVESKIAAAVEAVAQGVVAQFAEAIKTTPSQNIAEFSPEMAASISGIFDSAETNALILSPAQYAKLIPTSTFGFDPSAEGAYGINHIYKSTGTGDAVAMTADAVAGAIATPQVLMNHGGRGVDVRVIGNVAGFPLILKSEFDWNETLKCSIETMAGFKVVNATGIKKYTVGE